MMAAQFLLILLSLFTSVYSCNLDLVTSQTVVHLGHFDSTVITCKLVCPDDDVTDLRWYDNRNFPISYAPLRVFATFYKESIESRLFLRDVKADDNGTYTCVAKTNKQTITKSVDVFITNTVSQYVGELIHDRERRANRNSTKIRVKNNKKNTVGKRTKKKQRNKERKNKNKNKGKKNTPKKMRPVQNPDLSKTTTKPAPIRSTRKPFTRKRTTTSDVKTTSVTSTVHHSTHDSDAVRNDLVTSSHWDTASSDTPSKTSNDITPSTDDVKEVTTSSSFIGGESTSQEYMTSGEMNLDLTTKYKDTSISHLSSKATTRTIFWYSTRTMERVSTSTATSKTTSAKPDATVQEDSVLTMSGMLSLLAPLIVAVVLLFAVVVVAALRCYYRNRGEKRDKKKGGSVATKTGDKESTAVNTESPGDKESTVVNTESPGDKESTAVNTESPGDKESTVVNIESPGDKESTAVNIESPGDKESAAELVNSAGAAVSSESSDKKTSSENETVQQVSANPAKTDEKEKNSAAAGLDLSTVVAEKPAEDTSAPTQETTPEANKTFSTKKTDEKEMEAGTPDTTKAESSQQDAATTSKDDEKKKDKPKKKSTSFIKSLFGGKKDKYKVTSEKDKKKDIDTKTQPEGGSTTEAFAENDKKSKSEETTTTDDPKAKADDEKKKAVSDEGKRIDETADEAKKTSESTSDQKTEAPQNGDKIKVDVEESCQSSGDVTEVKEEAKKSDDQVAAETGAKNEGSELQLSFQDQLNEFFNQTKILEETGTEPISGAQTDDSTEQQTTSLVPPPPPTPLEAGDISKSADLAGNLEQPTGKPVDDVINTDNLPLPDANVDLGETTDENLPDEM